MMEAPGQSNVQQQQQKDERDEVVEKFRNIIGSLLDKEDINKNDKRKQRAPKELAMPYRLVYTREFMLRCADSPYATLPPKNMPEIVINIGDVVSKFPRRFQCGDGSQ